VPAALSITAFDERNPHSEVSVECSPVLAGFAECIKRESETARVCQDVIMAVVADHDSGILLKVDNHKQCLSRNRLRKTMLSWQLIST
jgi:hypothetical protein